MAEEKGAGSGGEFVTNGYQGVDIVTMTGDGVVCVTGGQQGNAPGGGRIIPPQGGSVTAPPQGSLGTPPPQASKDK